MFLEDARVQVRLPPPETQRPFSARARNLNSARQYEAQVRELINNAEDYKGHAKTQLLCAIAHRRSRGGYIIRDVKSETECLFFNGYPFVRRN